jgi:hypothetical protein
MVKIADGIEIFSALLFAGVEEDWLLCASTATACPGE